MAYYFLTASKDASVYLQQPNQNTGFDEILEISKVYYGNVKDVSHTLLKFEVGYISKSISEQSIKLDTANLILKETKSEEIPLEYTIYANPIFGNWEMGTGTRFDNITTAGVTWNYREGDSKLEWIENAFEANTTASINDGSGGTWYTNYGSSQSFNYQTADINMNVKSMLTAWMSGSIQNNGIILKYSTENESDTQDYGILKFFSKETNTIYQPKIQIVWDDQVFTTASLFALSANDIKVGVTNLKKEYKIGTEVKLKIFGRELYPLKTFTNTFSYETVRYLPQTTYYQIKDVNSDDVIIPFSNYSKVSCDETGNYIKINFSNWEAGRTYKIEFKVDNDGDIQYFDNDTTFSLIKY
jgi:hypothetical protein